MGRIWGGVGRRVDTMSCSSSSYTRSRLRLRGFMAQIAARLTLSPPAALRPGWELVVYYLLNTLRIFHLHAYIFRFALGLALGLAPCYRTCCRSQKLSEATVGFGMQIEDSSQHLRISFPRPLTALALFAPAAQDQLLKIIKVKRATQPQRRSPRPCACPPLSPSPCRRSSSAPFLLLL